jgi:SET domain-containing protein
MPPRLIVRSSSIHAAGCYTLDPIQKGQRVAEYSGQRLHKDDADRRYEGRVVTYLFAVGDKNMVIDGFGAAMFLNHSCNPNCQTVEPISGRIFISALRDIAPGEELVYEYNLCDSDDDDADCYCGAPQCRGTMFSEDEVKRQKRKAARKKKSAKT